MFAFLRVRARISEDDDLSIDAMNERGGYENFVATRTTPVKRR